MDKITIDTLSCIGCGSCVKDCVAGALYIKDGKAALRRGCIECGHCYAICPVGAVDMPAYDTGTCGEPASMSDLDSNLFLQAIKSRRTIRQFKDLPVEKAKLRKILEAGRYAPTGANSQNVAFTILGSRQQALEKECVRLFRAGVDIGSKFTDFLTNMEIDDRFFFKGAPLVIVVSGRDSVNASLASAYMELEANSLGLGVLYSGFFCALAKLHPKIGAALKLPRGHKVVTCMIFGYPAVQYQRIPPRKKRQVKIL